MSDIADKLRRAILFLKQLECKCRPVRDDVDLVCHRCCALAEFPDPDAVGTALEKSVELQSHYAELLNGYDGGKRLMFSSVEAWMNRLAALAKLEGKP